jgi:hypothetical protein
MRIAKETRGWFVASTFIVRSQLKEKEKKKQNRIMRAFPWSSCRNSILVEYLGFLCSGRSGQHVDTDSVHLAISSSSDGERTVSTPYIMIVNR